MAREATIRPGQDSLGQDMSTHSVGPLKDRPRELPPRIGTYPAVYSAGWPSGCAHVDGSDGETRPASSSCNELDSVLSPPWYSFDGARFCNWYCIMPMTRVAKERRIPITLKVIIDVLATEMVDEGALSGSTTSKVTFRLESGKAVRGMHTPMVSGTSMLSKVRSQYLKEEVKEKRQQWLPKKGTGSRGKICEGIHLVVLHKVARLSVVTAVRVTVGFICATQERACRVTCVVLHVLHTSGGGNSSVETGSMY